MLIRFSIENFLSFKDRAVFSMLPGRERLKADHKIGNIKNKPVLKVCAIYGANASGKSNLVKAIRFGKQMVAEGPMQDEGISYQAFRLSDQPKSPNSRIEYEFQYAQKNYAYGFVFNATEIVEEWLYEVDKRRDVKIYERSAGNKFDLLPLLKNIPDQEKKQFILFIAKATPSNQLFIRQVRRMNAFMQVPEVKDLQNVNKWFLDILQIVLPDAKYKTGTRFMLKKDDKFEDLFAAFLKYFDTGISNICLKPLDFDKIELPAMVKDKIKKDLNLPIIDKDHKNASCIITIVAPSNSTYIFSKNKEGIVQGEKIMTQHQLKNGKTNIYFETADESDGTNRLMDLILLLIELIDGEKIFIIDEMERSLHPNIVYDIIDLFLEFTKGKEKNSQLVLTTHESQLLTQKLLRKDEIFFIRKGIDASSCIYSLQDYAVRFDKAIRSDYLLGRYSGIPKLGNRFDLLEHFNNRNTKN